MRICVCHTLHRFVLFYLRRCLPSLSMVVQPVTSRFVFIHVCLFVYSRCT